MLAGGGGGGHIVFQLQLAGGTSVQCGQWDLHPA